jgi:hypothetical protein
MRTTCQLLMSTVLALSLSACSQGLHEHHNPLSGPVETEPLVLSQAPGMDSLTVFMTQYAYAQGHKRGTQLYWIINDMVEKENRAVYDITITIGESQQRFIIGMTDGIIEVATEIDLDKEPNCQHESDQYEGKDQA